MDVFSFVLQFSSSVKTWTSLYTTHHMENVSWRNHAWVRMAIFRCVLNSLCLSLFNIEMAQVVKKPPHRRPIPKFLMVSMKIILCKYSRFYIKKLTNLNRWLHDDNLNLNDQVWIDISPSINLPHFQMAFQLAFYREHQEITKTYEPSTGR